MKRYGALIRNTFIASLFFRVDFLFMVLGNLLGVFVVYYLWQAVYAGSGGSLNGLGFLQAFAYVAVSGSIFTMIDTGVDWEMGLGISRGSIIMNLYLPMDLHLLMMFKSLGVFLFRIIFIGVPMLVFIIFVFQVPIPPGLNLIFFAVSLFFSFLLAFNIDFMAGVSAYSFESILGLKIVKDTIILFLSGAVIPLPFFPKGVQSVLMVLPFQAMFYTPVNLLLGGKTAAESLLMLVVQAGWIVFFVTGGRLFHHRIMGKLTVSGG
jgi:ABC-2 type transport system permease protein